MVQSEVLQNLDLQVKYVINGKHEFVFAVMAKIEPVKLQLSKHRVKLVLSEESVLF